MNETKLTVPADRPVILIERGFDAPRHLVWEATTMPDLVHAGVRRDAVVRD